MGDVGSPPVSAGCIILVDVRAIIDSRGLPEAVRYYGLFPREPGSTRELDFPVDPVDSVSPMTLLAAMDHMVAAGGQGENEVLIVAHGEERGFLMPVARGGVSAMEDALEDIMDAEDPLDRAAAIPALPADQRVAAWRSLINELSPGSIQGEITEQDGTRWFNQWKAAQARNLRVQVADFERLVSRMKQVRRAGFERIEIRACNIGANQAALETLKRFFGAAMLCAPNVGTFYVSVSTVISANERREQAWLRRFGAGVSGGVYAGRTGPEPRSDTIFVPARYGPIGFSIDDAFRILVWETSLRPHRYASQAFSAQWSYVKAWVELNIMVGSVYSRGVFILAGMWTFGQGGQPFATPTDNTYRQCLVCAE